VDEGNKASVTGLIATSWSYTWVPDGEASIARIAMSRCWEEWREKLTDIGRRERAQIPHCGKRKFVWKFYNGWMEKANQVLKVASMFNEIDRNTSSNRERRCSK